MNKQENENNNKPQITTDVILTSELVNNTVLVEVNPEVNVSYAIGEDIDLSLDTKFTTTSNSNANFTYDEDSYTFNTDIGITFSDFKLKGEIKSLFLNSAGNLDVAAIVLDQVLVPAAAAVEEVEGVAYSAAIVEDVTVMEDGNTATAAQAQDEVLEVLAVAAVDEVLEVLATADDVRDAQPKLEDLINFSLEGQISDFNVGLIMYDTKAVIYDNKKYGLSLGYKSNALKLELSLNKDDKINFDEIEIDFGKLSEMMPSLEVLKDLNIAYEQKKDDLIIGYSDLIDITFNTDSTKFTTLDFNVSEFINSAFKRNAAGIRLEYDIEAKTLKPKFTSAFNLFKR